MNKQLLASEISINFHAETIVCALQNRTTGRAVGFEDRSWRLILLTSGHAAITAPDQASEVTGPCLVCQPWTKTMRLRVTAGSTGEHVLISERLLTDAIGHGPESSELRLLSDHRATLDLSENRTGLTDAATCFELIRREAGSNLPGSEYVIAAQIRVLLVLLWRASFDLGPVTLPSQPVLRQFRNLVEVHFRSRWPVSRYAAEIGIPYDRLHDLCSRSLDKSPLQLIHERLCYEACQMLERTSMTNDQIAASLGFSTASHFNTFFKKSLGTAPGAYRKSTAPSPQGQPDSPGGLFSDWP